MEILNYLLASKRAQTTTLSHTDLLIPSVFRGWITMCKSRSPATLNEAIVTALSLPLTPPTLVRGPHTPVKPRRPQHQSIHSAEPLEVIGNTHTNRRDFHIRSGLEGRSLETRSANSFCSSRCFLFLTFLFCTFVLLSLFLPIKGFWMSVFKWLFAGDVLSSQQEPETREKSYELGLWGFKVSVFQRHTYRFHSLLTVRTKRNCPWPQMCVFAGRSDTDVTLESDWTCWWRFVLRGRRLLYNFPLCWLLCGSAVCMCNHWTLRREVSLA